MKHILGLLTFCAVAATLPAQTPEWIWHDNKGVAPGNNERRFFRKTFVTEGKVQKATLMFTVDNEGTAFINGRSAASVPDWHEAASVDVTADIKPGANVLALRGINHGGAAGVVARLEMMFADGKKMTVATDSSWVSFPEDVAGWQQVTFKAEDWKKAMSIAKLGAEPWGDVFSVGAVGAGGAKAAPKRQATSPEQLYAPPGFKVELLHSAEPEEGSWVNLCKDNKGRLILSPQWGRAPVAGEKRGLLRITLAADGTVAKREFIAQPLYDAQGMLWVGNALYVVVKRESKTKK